MDDAGIWDANNPLWDAIQPTSHWESLGYNENSAAAMMLLELSLTRQRDYGFEAIAGPKRM